VICRFAEYLAIAWLSLPVTLLAQGAPGSIQGIVCEIKTCKPIDGVQVWLVHPGSEVPVKTMRTNVSGEFGFFDLQPGTYMVRARADNFNTRSGAPSAAITNGERIENVKLELTSLGTISGNVLDENGEPVVGARVEVLAGLLNSPFFVLYRMVAVPQASVTTDN
jgi:large repetitive protein